MTMVEQHANASSGSSPHTPRKDGPAVTDSAVRSTSRPDQPSDLQQAVLDGVGGLSGMVYSALPVVVFATAVSFFPLPVTVGISIAFALALAVFRMCRGERLTSATGGVLGVAAAGGVSAWTGSADDFFLIGIWAALAGAVVTFSSLLVRRPLTGVVWNSVHGGAHRWREDRPSLQGHDLATLAIAVLFAARYVVKEGLYAAGSTGWLAFAKIAMGTPLTLLAALMVVWAFRRSTKRLVKSSVPDATQN